jgi:hypothetical protein
LYNEFEATGENGQLPLKGGISMPVTNSRDLIPFVNSLEVRINNLNTDMQSWTSNKNKILNALPQVDRNKDNALMALVKAEDALAEINTATFGVIAAKGDRLRTLLENLKNQVMEIAQNAATGGVAVEQYIKDEINNAIAEVDAVVDDGLKLDYRLRKIQEMAQEGVDFKNRDIIMPYKWESDTIVRDSEILLPPEAGVQYIDGDVTVLNETGDKGLLTSSNSLLRGKIDATGKVTLDEAPNQKVKIYFPVKLHFKDVPDDFLYYLVETVVSKTSPLMEMLLKFEKLLNDVMTDILAMKGENWTVDYSIMRNHKEIVQEQITPKGLCISVEDGIVHATFSYNDHPYLDHFVLEKWDEEKNDWVPYDGEYGIVGK